MESLPLERPPDGVLDQPAHRFGPCGRFDQSDHHINSFDNSLVTREIIVSYSGETDFSATQLRLIRFREPPWRRVNGPEDVNGQGRGARLMRTALLVALVLGFLIGIGFLFVIERDAGGIDLAAPKAAALSVTSGGKAVAFNPDRVAADGVVEGARPEVAIRPDVAGILATVHVRETQDVARGTLLAELDNETQKQRVALAVAELARARSQLDRLRNGERAERRKAAAAVEQAREVIVQQTKADWERSRRLAENRSASREEFDRSYYTMLRAQRRMGRVRGRARLHRSPGADRRDRDRGWQCGRGRGAAAAGAGRAGEDPVARPERRPHPPGLRRAGRAGGARHVATDPPSRRSLETTGAGLRRGTRRRPRRGRPTRPGHRRRPARSRIRRHRRPRHAPDGPARAAVRRPW